MYWRVPGTSTGVDAAYSFHSFEDPYFSPCFFSSMAVARRRMVVIMEGPRKASTQWYLLCALVGSTDQQRRPARLVRDIVIQTKGRIAGRQAGLAS